MRSDLSKLFAPRKNVPPKWHGIDVCLQEAVGKSTRKGVYGATDHSPFIWTPYLYVVQTGRAQGFDLHRHN